MSILQTILYYIARELKFDYLISTAHPDNIASRKTLEKIGLEPVKTTTVANGYLRKIYLKKL
jgi:RimJ/RimL family protein N-acetyltransferase